MNVENALKKGNEILSGEKIKSAFLDAEILLLSALAKSKSKPEYFTSDRAWLHAHRDCPLTKLQKNRFLSFIKRRERFEPIAYITGKKEFFGLEFQVNKNVLIPRPETEILVEEALKEILNIIGKKPKRRIIIADIGTGSGAIGVATAKILKNKGKIAGVKIYATDISPKALGTAKLNARLLGAGKNIIFKRGNLLKALPKKIKPDFLLANLPYVRNAYYKRLNDRRLPEFYGIKYEPKNALLAKNGGLEYFKKLFPSLPERLAKNAKIFLESDPRQIGSIKKLTKKYLPAHKITIIKDLRKLNRVTKIKII